MTLNETLRILDSLAAGYDPDTGESLPNDSVCNSRSVIRALQMAIDIIKTQESNSSTYSSLLQKKHSTVSPPKKEVQEETSTDIDFFLTDEKLFEYLNTFKEAGFTPTVARIGKCLIGTQAKSIYNYVRDFPCYGILEEKTTYGMIKPIISAFFEKYEMKINEEYIQADMPWEEIDFFEQMPFNQLTDFTINQLTETIKEMPFKKDISQMSSEAMVLARKVYPRAYEPWEQQENSLLLKTLRYTNDVELLSNIFKRGPGAIRSQGQRLLYQIAQSAMGIR